MSISRAKGLNAMRCVNHSRTSREEVTNEWNYTSYSPIYLHVVDRDTFTFTVLGSGLFYIGVLFLTNRFCT